MVGGPMELREQCGGVVRGGKWLGQGLGARGVDLRLWAGGVEFIMLSPAQRGRCTTQLPGGSRATNNRM
jgi:hypothetical protein